MLNSNQAPKFRNSKWRPQNWPIFEKIRRIFNSKYKITLYTLHGVFGGLESEIGNQISEFKIARNSCLKNGQFFQITYQIFKIKCTKLLFIIALLIYRGS